MFGGRKPNTPGSPAHQTQSIPAVNVPPNISGNQPPRPPQAVGFETVLGIHTTLKGELHCQANARIDGNFEGSVEVDGNVLIGETARITADIHGHNITIGGAVHGNVFGHKIQLLRTGRVWGDLNAASIVTDDGAFIDGKISMTSHPAAKGFDQRDDQQALPAPEINFARPSAEDAMSGEPVEVELMDDHTPTADNANK